LRGSGIWGYEDRSLVVGQNGSYRLARTVNEVKAGAGGLVLSPDGRYLAGQPDLEGAHWTDSRMSVAVVDLTTGKARIYSGHPIAFSPDGSLLVAGEHEPEVAGGMKDSGVSSLPLALLDLNTGNQLWVGSVFGDTREGNFTAFSPDGGRIAVATKDALYVVDVANRATRKLMLLNGRDRLAGPRLASRWHADRSVHNGRMRRRRRVLRRGRVR